MCNILTTLIRPNFEKPVETVKDLVERGIRVAELPGAQYWQQLYLSSPNEYYQKMGASMYFCKTYDEYDNLTVDMLANGEWGIIASFMTEYDLAEARKLHPQGRGYWEAKERLSERRYFNHF